MGQNQAKPASKSEKLRNFDIGYCKFFNLTDHSKVAIHFFVFCLLQMQKKKLTIKLSGVDVTFETWRVNVGTLIFIWWC